MRPEVEAALADQFGRPVPLELVVDGAPDEPVPTPTGPGDAPRSPESGPAPAAAAPAAPDDHEEDLSDFEAGGLEAADIDNSAEARLLQAFPGAEEVV